MTVEELINNLQVIKDKDKPIAMVIVTGDDFDGKPFTEESGVIHIQEEDNCVELLSEDLSWFEEGAEE